MSDRRLQVEKRRGATAGVSIKKEHGIIVVRV